MSNRTLLIVEDDPGLLSQMKWCFDDCEVATAQTPEAALKEAAKHKPQVITLDLGLPPDPGGATEGFKLLTALRAALPLCKIIVVTGREEAQNAVQAIGLGATDFYQKPLEPDTLRFAVDRAFRLHELESENSRLRQRGSASGIDGILTVDPGMLNVCRLIERVGPTDVNVLIQGDTGTGKELVARAIHELSNRADMPMTVINCAAIPENLLESELFGHEKGSFTGAVSKKIGRIEAADQGTLFLDEIGDMALPLQAKILRFLQERVIDRVGGTESIEIDARVVAATHQPLQEMVAQNTFREDLYFRLSEIVLELPPLSERQGDAVLLAKEFISRFSDQRALTLSAAAEGAIAEFAWPGNIRELENRIKRACIMCDSLEITPADLQLSGAPATATFNVLDLKTVRAQAEAAAVKAALSQSGDNISQAARLLGVSRPTLYTLMKRHDLEIE
ncbi:MAG: PEP-CTERM-box response regulator transcription factor [Pseudomonadales bacterium]